MKEEDRSEESLALEWQKFFVRNWAGIEFIKELSAQASADCLLVKPLAEIEVARTKISVYRTVLEHINNTVSNPNPKNRKERKNSDDHTGGHSITGTNAGTGGGNTTDGRKFNRWK